MVDDIPVANLDLPVSLRVSGSMYLRNLMNSINSQLKAECCSLEKKFKN